MSDAMFLHLNPASICDAVGHSPRMLEKVANLAVSTLRKQLEECAAAQQALDSRGLANALHGLRGSLSVLGAHRALSQLHYIEKIAIAAPEAAPALAELKNLASCVCEELARLVMTEEASLRG